MHNHIVSYLKSPEWLLGILAFCSVVHDYQHLLAPIFDLYLRMNNYIRESLLAYCLKTHLISLNDAHNAHLE